MFAVQLGPYLVHGARHVRVGVRPADTGQPEQVELSHPVIGAVTAGPDDAKTAAGPEHARDLGNCPRRVEPVPRRRDEHGVRAAVGQRHGLAPAFEDTGLRRPLREHGAHPLVRFDGDHLSRPAEQRAGEQPRAGGKVHRDLAPRGHQPVKRLGRRFRTHLVVAVCHIPERSRSFFTNSHNHHCERAVASLLMHPPRAHGPAAPPVLSGVKVLPGRN